MGYMSIHYESGKNFSDWCNEQYTYDDENISLEVVDCALVRRTEGYIALKRTIKKENKSYVFLLALKIQWSNDWFNFTYKELDESEYPYMFNCPERIFKKLSPIEDFEDDMTTEPAKNAIAWRTEVKKRIELRKKLKNGVKFEVDTPVDFGVFKATKFTVKNRRKRHYKAENYNGIVRLRDETIFSRKIKFIVDKD